MSRSGLFRREPGPQLRIGPVNVINSGWYRQTWALCARQLYRRGVTTTENVDKHGFSLSVKQALQRVDSGQYR